MAYIGLDVGTSGCKGAIVEQDGTMKHMAHREYKLHSLKPGYAELNPGEVWEQVQAVLKELAESGEQVTKIAVSSIGETMVILDENEKILMNGIVYLDERGKDTLQEIEDHISAKELYDITRAPLSHIYSLNNLLWIRKNHPDIEKKADKYFLFGDFINYKLTGKRMIDPSSASRTLFMDAASRQWSEKIAELFDVPLKKFSEIRPTGTNMGAILPEIAEATGLSSSLEVILGCHDQCSAMIGAGCTQRGDAVISEGSSESINLLIGQNDFKEAFYESCLCAEPFICDEQYMLPIGFLAHGTSIRWFLDKFGADFGVSGQKGIVNKYERADFGCPDECGDLICIPYLSSVQTRDVYNQVKGCFMGLDLTCDKGMMYRALLEGLCFETKAAVDVLRKLKLKMNSFMATGGCTKSSVFMQMKADMLGIPIQILKSPESGISGLAAICAVEDKVFPDLSHAGKAFAKVGKVYEPKRNYNDKYEKYKEMLKTMQMVNV